MAMMTLSALAIIRLALAFSPVLSASRSITRWTAIGALCIATGYLALSGASTATQRAFIMIAIVLFALMMGRRALTIRGLALAALLVLLIHPESLLGPSFQMSFAATLALVAGYGLLSRSPAIWKMRLKAAQTASFVPTFIARPVRTLAAIALTSLIAGLATAPFAAYHFSVGTPWALLGNMLALPLVSIIIMPAGLIALVLTPLALEGLPLQLMGLGLEGVMVIARWVASLDGAYVAIPAITPSALALMGLGGCALALAEGRARWLGLAPLLAIPFVGLFQPVPVMLVERTGRLVALVSQNDEGQTFLDRSVQNGSRFAVDMWSQRLAITPSFPQGQTAWTCDGLGCAAHLDERTLVVHVRDPAAMEEDCALAAILVTELEVPPGCGAPILVDGKLLQVHGAVALLPDSDAETGYRLWFSIHQRSRPWEAVGR
jgi:competence protein ComEC